MAIVSSRLSAARSLLQRHNLYGSPPRHSFYSCASSRALLHVGSLSLWDRQPSNAPPLLLSPAGLASRRGPHTKTRLGLCPKTPLPLNCGWIRTMRSIVRTARRRYALKVPAAHYMWGNCKSAAESYHRKACASLSNEGNELKNFPHSRSVNVEDCGEYIAGFGFQCYRLTSFLSVRPSR